MEKVERGAGSLSLAGLWKGAAFGALNALLILCWIMAFQPEARRGDVVAFVLVLATMFGGFAGGLLGLFAESRGWRQELLTRALWLIEGAVVLALVALALLPAAQP